MYVIVIHVPNEKYGEITVFASERSSGQIVYILTNKCRP